MFLITILCCIFASCQFSDPCEGVMCGLFAYCEESTGSCTCDLGFKWSPNHYDCQLITLCDNVVCGENSFCSLGICECLDDYEWSDDGYNCVDIDDETITPDWPVIVVVVLVGLACLPCVVLCLLCPLLPFVLLPLLPFLVAILAFTIPPCILVLMIIAPFLLILCGLCGMCCYFFFVLRTSRKEVEDENVDKYFKVEKSNAVPDEIVVPKGSRASIELDPTHISPILVDKEVNYFDFLPPRVMNERLIQTPIVRVTYQTHQEDEGSEKSSY